MKNKKSTRPIIASAKVHKSISDEEQFQNAVLRPIIKMQHNSIIALFNHYLQHSEFNIQTLEATKKSEFIRTAVAKNQSLRNQYVGMITGLFTYEELITYLTNASEYSKRIMQIISQRLQDIY